MDVAQIVAAFGLGGVISTVVYAVANRGKTRAEQYSLEAKATDILTRTATGLVEKIEKTAADEEARLNTQISTLKDEVAGLRGETAKLTAAIRLLIAQLKTNNIEPDPAVMQALEDKK